MAEDTENGSVPEGTETIEMSDGRKVTFVGKSRKMIRENIFDSSGRWTATRFDFRFEISDEYPENTLTVKAPGATDTVEVSGARRNSRDVLAAHGGSAKFGDAAAGCDTVEDMFESVRDTVQNFESGRWSERRESSGMAGTSVLLRALVELGKPNGRTVADARAKLKTLDAKTKLALRNSPELKPIVERLETARLAKASKVDTAAVLSEW